MQSAYNITVDGPVTEMAIVDTFTKLIFEHDGDYSTRELFIIQMFRAVEASVFRDSHQEMGDYLRNLGVREMIQLVSRLHVSMRDMEGVGVITASGCPGKGLATGFHTDIRGRRLH